VQHPTALQDQKAKFLDPSINENNSDLQKTAKMHYL